MRTAVCIESWHVTGEDKLERHCPSCASAQEVHGGFERLRPPKPHGSMFSRMFRRVFSPRTCQDCGRELAYRCECGEPLTIRSFFSGGALTTLAVAGSPLAGKTYLIAAIHDRLVSSGGQGPIVLGAGIGDTEARIGPIKTAYRTNAPLPKTHDEGTNMAWRLRVRGEGLRTEDNLLLALRDEKGETWRQGVEPGRDDFARYISHVSKLIFVVDGADLAESLALPGRDEWDSRRDDRWGHSARRWFEDVTDVLGEKTANTDLAIVISKGDRIWDANGREGLKPDDSEQGSNQKLIRKLLEEAGCAPILESARDFARHRLFVTSGLGFTPSNPRSGEGARTAPPSPIGVLAPLGWLLGLDALEEYSDC